MKNITDEAMPWIAQKTSRRTFIGRSTSYTFGALAALAVGVPRFKDAPALSSKAACGPSAVSPNCRATSDAFCGPGSTGTTCESGESFSCTKRDSGCDEDGDYCWTYNGRKCCDCTCSYFSGGGGTIPCICWS
jgi:hypothetical protein